MKCLTCKLIVESTTAGLFPPSSKITGVRCFAAAAITIRPTLGLPKTSSRRLKIVYCRGTECETKTSIFMKNFWQDEKHITRFLRIKSFDKPWTLIALLDRYLSSFIDDLESWLESVLIIGQPYKRILKFIEHVMDVRLPKNASPINWNYRHLIQFKRFDLI